LFSHPNSSRTNRASVRNGYAVRSS
jgi:hypothetical protein